MSKGDTTIRVDMEVAGASSAKMTAKDVFASMESASRKATSAEEAEMRKRAAAAKSLAAQKKKYTDQNKAREYREWELNEKKKIESAVLLQAQRSKALIDNANAVAREERRLARETAAEKKRLDREREREAKRRMREEERDAKKLAGQRGIASRMLHAGIMGVAGFGGVAGVASIFSAISQGMQNVIAKRSELEKAITPIIALEDNVNRIGSIREEVVRTSLAVGRSYDEVGQFYSDLVGSTGNLADNERQQLIKETKELAELTGGSLVTAQNLLTKSYQIYGKELVNVNQLQNKLMLTQDQGSITFEDMGLRLPELLQTGKFAGMGIDEVLGTVIGATRRSGSIEKTMTGMRNFFLIMEESQKKGVTLTGTYQEKLQQLSEMFTSNAPKMQELFGKEVVVHASSITDAIGEIATAVGELGDVTGETDAVADKLAKKFRDSTYFSVRNIENLRQVMESAPNLANDAISDSWIMQMHRRGLQGATAVGVGTGGIFGKLGEASGYIGGILNPSMAQEGSDIAASTRDDEFFKQSMRQQFFDKKEADLQNIKMREMMIWTPLAGLANPFALDRDRAEVQNRQLSPHLMTPDELKTYRETGKAPTSADMSVANQSGSAGSGVVEDTKTHALLSETNRLLSNLQPSGNGLKPGGGRRNAEETL